MQRAIEEIRERYAILSPEALNRLVELITRVSEESYQTGYLDGWHQAIRQRRTW